MTFLSDRTAGGLRRIVEDLRGLHLRVSLFAFNAAPEDVEALEHGLRRAGERLGFVERGPDDMVLFLVVAPRPSHVLSLQESDEALFRQVGKALLGQLPRGGLGIEARAVHRWTDEVFDLDDLIAELDAPPPLAAATARERWLLMAL